MNKEIIKVLFLIFVNILFFSCNKKTKPILTPSPSYDIVEEDVTVNTEEREIKPIPATPPKPYVLVSLQKLGCFGICPDYEFALLSNGEASFHGKKYTGLIGKFSAQANAGILLNIQSKIKEVNFFQFEQMYPTNGNFIEELPDTYILVNHERQQLIVRNNHDAPKALLDFQKFIEDIINNLEWQKL